MSSRTSEAYIAAIDTNGKSHFVAYEYDYGGGYYRSVTCLGERKYEIECPGDGEYTIEKGQKLPRLESTDIASYFSKEPTQAMYRAIALASIGCTTISATNEAETQFVLDRVPNEIFGDSVEDIAADILEKGIDGYAAYLDSVRRQ